MPFLLATPAPVTGFLVLGDSSCLSPTEGSPCPRPWWLQFSPVQILTPANKAKQVQRGSALSGEGSGSSIQAPEAAAAVASGAESGAHMAPRCSRLQGLGPEETLVSPRAVCSASLGLIPGWAASQPGSLSLLKIL